MNTISYSTSCAISPASFVRKIITVATIKYGLGKIGKSYFVMNMDSETWRSFTSKSAFNWFVETLIEAGDRLNPDPDPIPVALEVVQIAAVAAPITHEFTIRIAADQTCVRCGETIDEFEMCDPCARIVARDSSPDSETIRHQHYMMARTGIDHPLRAHDAMMAAWLAKHQ